MAHSETLTLRPRNDNYEDWCVIVRICQEKGIKMSEVFNAVIGPISYCMQHLSRENETDFTMELNLGKITVHKQ